MITIRPMSRTNDPAEAFVYDAWRKSLIASRCDEPEWFELSSFLASVDHERASGPVRDYVQCLLKQPSTSVFIAGAADDPQLLLGFVCAEPGRVHYVYVKKRLRERGVCRALLAHAQVELGAFTRASTLTRHWTHGYAQRLHLTYDPSIERKA